MQIQFLFLILRVIFLLYYKISLYPEKVLKILITVPLSLAVATKLPDAFISIYLRVPLWASRIMGLRVRIQIITRPISFSLTPATAGAATTNYA